MIHLYKHETTMPRTDLRLQASQKFPAQYWAQIQKSVTFNHSKQSSQETDPKKTRMGRLTSSIQQHTLSSPQQNWKYEGNKVKKTSLHLRSHSFQDLAGKPKSLSTNWNLTCYSAPSTTTIAHSKNITSESAKTWTTTLKTLKLNTETKQSN